MEKDYSRKEQNENFLFPLSAFLPWRAYRGDSVLGPVSKSVAEQPCSRNILLHSIRTRIAKYRVPV